MTLLLPVLFCSPSISTGSLEVDFLTAQNFLLPWVLPTSSNKSILPKPNIKVSDSMNSQFVVCSSCTKCLCSPAIAKSQLIGITLLIHVSFNSLTIILNKFNVILNIVKFYILKMGFYIAQTNLVATVGHMLLTACWVLSSRTQKQFIL